VERRRSRPGRRIGATRGWKPRLGETYVVKIVEISKRGDGIARIRGLVVFVPGASLGSTVKVRITRVGRRHAEAEVVPVEE